MLLWGCLHVTGAGLPLAVVFAGFALGGFTLLERSPLKLGWAIGGEDLGALPCDGLICATPSGSTAYNLSNGGPVLVWGLDAMAVTFIAPHSLHARPLVIPPGSDVIVWNRTDDVEAGVGEALPEDLRNGNHNSFFDHDWGLRLQLFVSEADRAGWVPSRLAERNGPSRCAPRTRGPRAAGPRARCAAVGQRTGSRLGARPRRPGHHLLRSGKQ